MDSGPAVSLRQRVKDQMRSEVAQRAIALFLERGFEQTTVDEVCAAAGMSRRTFFRYFKGKDEIVGSWFGGLAEAGCQAFVERPADEDLWIALRHCMDPFVAWTEADQPRALEMIRLVEETPALQANYHAHIDQWRASLAAVIARRVGLTDPDDLQAAVIAAASMGAFVAGARAWLAREGKEPVAPIFDHAFAAVTPNRVGQKFCVSGSE